MFAFLLGREFKLSIAEILALFIKSKVVFFVEDFLILSGISKSEVLENVDKLGGTIKIVELGTRNIIDDARENEGKFKYAINVYGAKGKNKQLLNDTKKSLKNNEISSRFVNNDFKNLTSAQIIGEKLVKRGTDYNYFYVGKELYFGKTIWVQDINAYSKRDYSKDRDMQIGMLPPKLSQMMINIGASKDSIFDPFVGLGTILIEASLMGYTSLFGSDLNDKMVEVSEKNIKKFISSTLSLTLSPNGRKGIIKELGIEKLNAKFINESKFIDKTNLIVSEGYLGEVMTRKNISIDRINKQRQSLKELYERFFENLTKTKFDGNIVICFPFWEMNSKYYYTEDIYEILNKYCVIEKIFPKEFENLTTKIGSLLYKRENQLVGREIFKLKIKKF